MSELNILMVENSATDADLLLRTIASALPTASVHRVERVEDASQQLETGKYHVVLLDLSLPERSGLSALRQLVVNDDIAVVALAGSEDSEVVREALKAGAQDYLLKGEVEPRLVGRCIEYAYGRKQSDRLLSEKDGQLLQKQRIEALGKLAGGVAHEFNNLLQIIQTYAGFALEGLDADCQRAADLNEVLGAADRAARLTSQLLGFSRQHNLHCSTVDTNKSITQLMQMLRPLLGEHIRVSLDLDEGTGAINVDTALFDQMLTNVCVNGRDAMPHGGDLNIATRQVALAKDFTDYHPDLQPGNYVAIMVADTGCGMPAEMVARIFDPFFTTKEVGKGTGLGLSMVYGAVKQHGGTINVYSEPGLGTTIRIYLPAVAGTGRPYAEAALQTESPQGSELILLAEDEPGVRNATRRILERAGYRLVCASDGAEAIRVFQEHKDSIAAAVLDAIMPTMTGRHVYEAIKLLNPDVPVIFCTGFDKETGVFDFVEREGLPILSKPFQPADMLKTLREVIDAAITMPPFQW